VKDATDAIITANGELAVTTWNDGAEAMFGYTPEEAVGRDIRDLIVPNEILREVESRIATLKSGQRLSHETTLRNKNGEPVAVSVTATPEIDPPDEFVGFSAILRDVRSRKRDEEAERSRQHLELANRLAHEINNPLQAVQNCLSILSHGDGASYVQLAEEQLARVTQVVLDLVKLTKAHEDLNS
jgi:PAS domain S-box-containing protein